jgi:hypothetical protein
MCPPNLLFSMEFLTKKLVNILQTISAHRAFLDAQEFCYIDEISYGTIGKSVLVHVAKLRLTRTKNGRRIDSTFQIWCGQLIHLWNFLFFK